MSRLDIKTPSKAQMVVEHLYRSMEHRIEASPPADGGRRHQHPGAEAVRRGPHRKGAESVQGEAHRKNRRRHRRRTRRPVLPLPTVQSLRLWRV